MRAAQAVGLVLARLGAGPVFGVVGSGNFEFTNALRDNGVEFYATRHEMGAATAADAFARMSGRVTIVSTHQGCGLTNSVTGLGEAAKSRTPMLVLTADTPDGDALSNFRIDQDALVRSVGAVSIRVGSAEDAVADAVRAYRTALHERRTVVLHLPLDVQAEEVAGPDGLPEIGPAPVIEPADHEVDGLAELIAGAKRPVFVAGRGARAAGGEIAALAEKCGALLATSAVANGLFHDSPWSLGISGGFAAPLTAELITGADLIVGWGCALNRWTTKQGKLIGPDARLAQVDVERAALGAHRPVTLGVLGDAALTATAVAGRLAGRELTGYRSAELEKRIAAEGRWSLVVPEDTSTDSRIDPRTLSAELDRILPAERVIGVDSGNFMGYPSAYLSVPDENGFCFTQAFQSIGLGLATALGAALAQPDRLPVAALGDGGFHMALAELETAVRLRLPLVIVVYNDAAYGAEVHHFAGDHTTVRFPDTDAAAIGRGFGATGITVRRVADLEEVRTWLAGPRAAPLVIDAKLTDDGGSWWLAEAFHSH
ncbi:MAG TPA: thiamine pyrophosphate-binding protein [Pseudonocardiaceae bacterium]|jgi:thiamine pyrophosphate-dependent acetolactate synthase large subunit-like protein|nr:thiamine pyrophosphate-binding protein [Pseudonocardiaceae bacterium]